MRALLVFALIVWFVPKTQADCDWAEFQHLSSEDLAEHVAGQDENCLRFLWDKDGKLKQVFSDSNMLAVVHRLKNARASGLDPEGRRALMLFARIGFYHHWYGRPVGFDKSMILHGLLQALHNMEREFRYGSQTTR